MAQLWGAQEMFLQRQRPKRISLGTLSENLSPQSQWNDSTTREIVPTWGMGACVACRQVAEIRNPKCQHTFCQACFYYTYNALTRSFQCNVEMDSGFVSEGQTKYSQHELHPSRLLSTTTFSVISSRYNSRHSEYSRISSSTIKQRFESVGKMFTICFGRRSTNRKRRQTTNSENIELSRPFLLDNNCSDDQNDVIPSGNNCAEDVNHSRSTGAEDVITSGNNGALIVRAILHVDAREEQIVQHGDSSVNEDVVHVPSREREQVQQQPAVVDDRDIEPALNVNVQMATTSGIASDNGRAWPQYDYAQINNIDVAFTHLNPCRDWHTESNFVSSVVYDPVNSEIHAVDRENDTIIVYNNILNKVRHYGGRNLLLKPHALAVTSDGDILVVNVNSDVGQSSVNLFDNNGNCRPNIRIGYLVSPKGIARLEDFVCVIDCDQIILFRKALSAENNVQYVRDRSIQNQIFQSVHAIAVMNDNTLIMTCDCGVLTVNTVTEEIRQINLPVDDEVTINGLIPRGVKIDANKFTLVVYENVIKILRPPPEYHLYSTIRMPPSFPVNDLQDIAVLPDTRLVVVGNGGLAAFTLSVLARPLHVAS